jgi:hypothetical protein
MDQLRAKLIDYNSAVQLALPTLKEAEENEEANIYSICEIPFDHCKIYNAEKDHQ